MTTRPIFESTDLPSRLRKLGISLRQESTTDFDFLLQLYLSVRWPEFARTGWPDSFKLDFLTSQWKTQTLQYNANYPGMERWILQSTIAPVGRLYLLASNSELRVVDISLLPEWRGRGIGTALLNQLGCKADDLGLVLRLHVEQHNPALRLYRRLGFQERDTSGPYWLMERKPPNASTI